MYIVGYAVVSGKIQFYISYLAVIEMCDTLKTTSI
jgi:hypothetical protein